MEKNFVNTYLITNGKFFPESNLRQIGAKLELSNLSEVVVNVSYRNPLLFTLFYWFMPFFWLLDRFFVRDFLGGVVKALLYPFLMFTAFAMSKNNSCENCVNLLGLGVLLWFIWVIVDGISIYRRVKLLNYRKLDKVLGERLTATSTPYFSIMLLLFAVGVNVLLYTQQVTTLTPYENSAVFEDDTINQEYKKEKSKDKIQSNPFDVDREIVTENTSTSPFEEQPVVSEEPYSSNTHNRESVVFSNDVNKGFGIAKTEVPKKREIIHSINYNDIEFFEDCNLEFNLVVNNKGVIKHIDNSKYSPANLDSNSKRREKRKWTKKKDELLSVLTHKLHKDLLFEKSSINRTLTYVYKLSVTVLPYNVEVLCSRIG